MSVATAPLRAALPAMGRVSRSMVAAGLSLLLVAGLAGAGYLAVRARPARLPLASDTVAIGPGGEVVEASADEVLPGTRVLASAPDADRLVAEEREWLAAGTVPSAAGVDADLVSSALLDLHVLSRSYGVPVAGWSGPWRNVWPRDSALAASALARTGHLADAAAILDFLQRAQPQSGLFAARYTPDGAGVPDGRGVQLDGVGWALWGLAEVTGTLPQGERAGFVRRYQVVLDRSATAAQAMIDNARTLPPASPDYWEVPERRPTTATAALVAAGLESAAGLYAVLGADAQTARYTAAAARLRTAIRTSYGPAFPRHLGGKATSVDLGVSFLLPPFADQADPTVVAAWQRAAPAMSRPAGGLAPGGSWRRDGVSWTNVTATYALTAAALGDAEQARAWLDWLGRHRTAAGSFPEKVLADGSPAEVAPLAWTAAAVLLTAETLAGD
jgi:GH15 family glucan-1,4-alpha-glucosidase